MYYVKKSNITNSLIRELSIIPWLGSHPNIVKYYNFDQTDTINIKMEKLSSCESLTFANLKKLISALAYLEEMNIVHGDVRKENIMSKKNNPVLIDFDMAYSIHLASNIIGKRYNIAYYTLDDINDKPITNLTDVYDLALSFIYINSVTAPTYVVPSMKFIENSILSFDDEHLQNCLFEMINGTSAIVLCKNYNIPYVSPKHTFLYETIDEMKSRYLNVLSNQNDVEDLIQALIRRSDDIISDEILSSLNRLSYHAYLV